MRASHWLAIGLIVLLSWSPARAGVRVEEKRDRMVVHEWGTFTALQAEDGRPLPGINTDDEPLPKFVHNLHGQLLVGPTEVPSVYFKGTPRVHPDVIVRLETPVIYFYPPTDVKGPVTVDVDVAFRGGWLTEYYPDAKAGAPGLDGGRFDFGPLNAGVTGTLSWKGLRVGGTENGPETDSPVWLAPRQVPAAASVTTAAGETERYLFYRGVGHINAPLRVTHAPAGDSLNVYPQFETGVNLRPEFAAAPMWLVDVRGDGAIAFRTVERASLVPPEGKPIASLPATFESKDYSADNLAAVRKALHAALVADGLYGDEADGLLNTWEVSYFKRPGLRLFFMVPQQWTEHVMPLRVSGSAEIRRVMVGRIEIVTPGQRELMKQIAAGPISNPSWVFEALKKAAGGKEDYYREEWFQQLTKGTRPLASVNIEIPNDYRAYLGLGRFRNALILDEQKRVRSDNLQQFIERYDLEAHQLKANRP